MEVYKLKREFNATPDLVWTAWTDPKHVAHWYGPGVETVIHGFDLRVGGAWLTEMKMGPNSMYQRADFTAIEVGKRLTCIQANTDAEWNVVDNMMMPDMPRLLELDVEFSAKGAGTEMLLTWSPYNATDVEKAAFAGAMSKMGGGWSAGMDLLEELLSSL